MEAIQDQLAQMRQMQSQLLDGEENPADQLRRWTKHQESPGLWELYTINHQVWLFMAVSHMKIGLIQ